MPDEPGDYASANGIRLWYRDEGDPEGEPLLLIMGLNSQLVLWPEEVVQALGERGYRVVRFDNRDCGRSDKIAATTPPGGVAYHLVDLAADTVGLLDHLGLSRVHLVGASMGGMIAQLIAIHHPERAATLCSIMSTTGNPGVGGPTAEAVAVVTRPTPADREEAIDHITEVYRVIGSRTHAEAEHPRRRQFAADSFDRGLHPRGAERQFTAVLRAVDRTPRLRRLDLPTAVVHGVEDSLINVSGGRATHDAVPGSTYLELPDMGHDLPQVLLPRLIDTIDANARTRSTVG
ncbi:alpha/beta fold hydrolase [Actinosynnema sp. NPDC050436]|uniref:alpha/beta fold hydrolase n=1 Tax=Actinosynnema sp. NPDC050436 TaxID=3155659 RepID=UPI0033F057A7